MVLIFSKLFNIIHLVGKLNKLFGGDLFVRTKNENIDS